MLHKYDTNGYDIRVIDSGNYMMAVTCGTECMSQMERYIYLRLVVDGEILHVHMLVSLFQFTIKKIISKSFMLISIRLQSKWW